MGEITRFESREAKPDCLPQDYYNFITNLRNFNRFIPGEMIKDWKADNDSCSFNISGMGDVVLRTSNKTPFTNVDFSGTVLASIGFNLHSLISSDNDGKARVKLIMEADLPAMLKMFASGPIRNFLEMLVEEMEKFESWNI